MIVFKLMVLPFPMGFDFGDYFIDRSLIKHTWRPMHDETALFYRWVSRTGDVLQPSHLPGNT